MKAMVLCAGFGTRLRPLTDKIPKPLVPLLGIPLLRYNFALLLAAGVREIVINTHHLGAEMEQGAILVARELGVDLHVSREDKQILGTGGGVRKAQEWLASGTFFLLNGDMLFDADLNAALEAHRQAGAVATMVLAPYPKGASYGAVEVDAGLNVRRVAGRGTAPDPALTKMHFTGVHVLEPAMLSRLPAEGESDINRTAYVRLIHEGMKVHGHVQSAYWGDLGNTRSLLRANLDALEDRVPLQRFRPHADPFAGMELRGPRILAHPTAQIEAGALVTGPVLVRARSRIGAGAVVGPDVVIGEDVRVDPGAQVRRAVLWDHTHLSSDENVSDAIAARGIRLDA